MTKNTWCIISVIFTLTAFSGSLYNFFLYWSADNYSETAELLAERLEHIFQPAVP